jgi:hypothetical protein
MSDEHTIDGRLVDVKRALPRDKAPGPAKWVYHLLFCIESIMFDRVSVISVNLSHAKSSSVGYHQMF